MKIDIHTHILPPKMPDWTKKFGYGDFVTLERTSPCSAILRRGGRFFRKISANCWDPGVRIEACDAQGVDLQVLSTVPVMFSYWARPRDTLDLSRFLNDHIAETVAAHPKRFIGLATLPMQDPELAIGELERCMKMPEMAGIEIATHVNDWNLDRAELFPIFRAARDLGAAVFVHPWEMMGQEKMSRYWLPWLVGMPAETTRAICSMIFGGVFERLPTLRVAFAHGGGSFVFTIGRIEHGFRVRPDLCAIDNPVNPRHYLGHFYTDALVHDARALRFLIDAIGTDRVALGTDYPFPLGEAEAGRLIESLDDLSAAQKEQLLCGSALTWLARRREDFAR
ncbi:MAG: amidohydrolase [Deltaproteobacteria bacterium]|nr:MAG: amidohydrolase [Deltaproteobacteria bacterium]